MLISDIPRRNARVFAHRPALADEHTERTWAQVDRWVDQLATTLLDLGLGRGQRLAVLARNSADLVALNYATARVGATMVPVNFWLRPRELAALLGDLTPAALLVGAENLGLAGEVHQLVDVPQLALDGPDDSLFARARTAPTDPVEVAVDERDPYMVIYTSGTSTGRTKGVIRPHRLAFLNAMNAANEFEVTEADRVVVSTPNFHVSFWDSQMQFVCLRGGSVWVEPAFKADPVLEAIARTRSTVVFGIPTTLQALVQSQQRLQRDLSSVRLVVLPARVERQTVLDVAKVFDVPVRDVRNGWGMTETGPYCVYLRGDEWLDRDGASGRDAVGVETRIVDEDGTVLGPGGLGEIQVRGDVVAPGYLNAPEENEKAHCDGWFRTRDLGWKDEQGYLYFFERQTDVIRRGGETISALEIESYLMSHPAVVEAAVIGVPDPHWEETPLAVIVTAEGYLVDAAELTAFCRQGMAGFKVPQYFEFVPELPHVSLGKVVKRDLVEKYTRKLSEAAQ